MEPCSHQEPQPGNETLTPWTTRAKMALLQKMTETVSKKPVKLQKTSKILLVILTTFLLTNPPGNCLVGETPQEMVARYGDPISTTETDGKSTMSFLKEDIYILSEQRLSRTVFEGYVKKSDPQVGFTLQEITPILEIQGGVLPHWTQREGEKYTLFLQKEKGIVAVWLKLTGHLIIATNSRYEEWQSSQEGKGNQE